jgi:hypothetical protein
MERLTRTLAATLVLGLLLVAGVAQAQVEAPGSQGGICPDRQIEENTSGEWGSITFTPDSGPLVLVVEEGYEVRLCLKKGNGYEWTDWYKPGTYSLESVTFFPDLGNDGFSHYDHEEKPWERPSTTTTSASETTTTTTATPPTTATTTTTSPTTTTSETESTPTTAPTPDTLPFTGPGEMTDVLLRIVWGLLLVGLLLLLAVEWVKRTSRW